MVKHTQTICWQIGKELFECVWPLCGVGAKRVKVIISASVIFIFSLQLSMVLSHFYSPPPPPFFLFFLFSPFPLLLLFSRWSVWVWVFVLVHFILNLFSLKSWAEIAGWRSKLLFFSSFFIYCHYINVIPNWLFKPQTFNAIFITQLLHIILYQCLASKI